MQDFLWSNFDTCYTLHWNKRKKGEKGIIAKKNGIGGEKAMSIGQNENREMKNEEWKEVMKERKTKKR